MPKKIIEHVEVTPTTLIEVWKDGTQVWKGEIDGLTRVIYWNPKKEAKPRGMMGFFEDFLKKINKK